MNEQYLVHFGIKGQKWGVRRFQNEDRTWTEAGKERYGSGGDSDRKSSTGGSSKSGRKGLTEGQKKALKTAAIVAGVAAAGVAAYASVKYVDAVKTEAWNLTVEKGENALARANEDTKFWEQAASTYAGMSQDKIKAGHDAVNQIAIDSINDTAAYNSSTFRNARATLKGNGKKSIPEIEAKGKRIGTSGNKHSEGRLAWEERLQNELVKKGYGYSQVNYGDGYGSKSIYGKNHDGSTTRWLDGHDRIGSGTYNSFDDDPGRKRK